MTLYGFLIGIGVVIGIEILLRSSKLFSYLDLFIIAISSLIGARVLFLLHNIEEISSGIINIFAIWDGGLAFFGALIGILTSILVISIIKRINFFEYSDKLLSILPLIQAIGRIGNYFNHELYGLPTTLPWAIYIPEEYRVAGWESYMYFHPVFAYEAILNLILFLLLFFLNKKERTKGLITGIYLIGYSIIRISMNILRIDKEYLFSIETSNLLSYIFLMAGVVLIGYSLIKYRRK